MSRDHLRFVLGGTYTPIDELLPLARHAEAVGFDTVSLSDHLFLPEVIASAYPYSKTGQLPFVSADPWSDPWVAIGAMAAATERVRFLTNVYVLPLRDPFSVAKAVATAAVLSGDRVALGVGVGWMREEFEQVGRSFTDRGARSNEMIEVMRLLWRNEPVEHHGRFFDFGRLRMSPAPSRPVPILVGGESEAARQRAARLGDGFISTPHRTESLLALAEDLRARRQAAGRADDPFDLVTVATDASTVEEHATLARHGITGVITVPWGYRAGSEATLEQKLAAMSAYSEAVILPVREAGIPVDPEPALAASLGDQA